MIDREFFLGFVKVHILHHAAGSPFFGSEMAEELERHGYSIGPGTLYPALHRLWKEGYLKSSSRVVNGKIRKYYRITAKGQRVLEDSKKKIKELVDEVLKES